MRFKQYMVKYRLTEKDMAAVFHATPLTIRMWLERGVPKTRRAEVIAKTNGEVSFRDEVSTEDSAMMHLEAAIFGLEDLQVSEYQEGRRIRMQFYCDILRKVRSMIGKDDERK